MTPSSPDETKSEPPSSPSFIASVLVASITLAVLSLSTEPYLRDSGAERGPSGSLRSVRGVVQAPTGTPHEIELTRIGSAIDASASANARNGSLAEST